MLVKYARMHGQMAKFRHCYATQVDQKQRLRVARQIANEEKEMANLYVNRVMSERHK